MRRRVTRARRASRRAAALAALSWIAVGCAGVDQDGDGHPAERDCDDGDPAVHPGAPEYWDLKDNDCDGVVDVSSRYRWFDEIEPNDALIDTCYRGAGQWLGALAPVGMVSRLDGRVDTVVDEDYDRGDADCFGFALEQSAELHLEIRWPEADTDLDFVVWSDWEGEPDVFIASQSTAPFVDAGSSLGAMSRDHPIYLWVSAYAGAPTPYRVTMWTTRTTGDGDAS